MSNKDMEKLQTLMARRTEKMRKILDDDDLGNISRTAALLDETMELGDDLMLLIADMHERRVRDIDRDYDRYDDDYDRGRGGRNSDWRGRRDDDRGRGRGR